MYGLPLSLIKSNDNLTNIIQDYDTIKDKIINSCVVGDSVEIIFLKRNDKIDNLLDGTCDSIEKTRYYGFDTDTRDKYGISKDEILYLDIFISANNYEQGGMYSENTDCAACCAIL